MIKKITHLESYYIRHPVLRAGKSITSCHFDGDEFKTTTHFGYFIDDKLVGVASVFENKSIFFDDEHSYQIRGMAILEKYQNRGLGRILMRYCEKYVQNDSEKLIWFNARINAVKFYEKLGYSIIGNVLEIKEAGTHLVMYKQLVV